MDKLYILWAPCSEVLGVKTNGYMVRYWYCHGPYGSLSNELGFINGPSCPNCTSLHLENDSNWETPKAYD